MATLNTSPSAALRRVWASAPKGDAALECLSLSHSRFTRIWHMVSAHSGFTGVLEDGTTVTFEGYPFSVKLPASDAQGGQLLDITLANAGREMVAEIEAASQLPTERIQVTYRVFLESDKTAPQNLPIRLSLDSVSMTNEAITAQAGKSDFLNMPFPSVVYRPDVFPGLLR